MKKLSAFAMLIALSGCSATNYADFELSNASISNVEVKETADLSKREHVINITFDYTIDNYNPVTDLYICSVLFVTADGMSVTSHKRKTAPCKISNAAGNVTIDWPTPLDKSLKSSSEILSKIKYPIEYFVAIHQKTGSRTNQIIGKSEKMLSGIKL
jgi:hypothetical protein